MTPKRTKPIPEEKVRAVKEIVNYLKENKTFLIASIKNLPGGQYQTIKHKLKAHAKVKVLKKSLILRAIGAFDKKLEKIREYVREDCAFLFSKKEPFELSAILSNNLSPAKAKIGQVVPEDIKVNEGPTNLAPGPVISELGALEIPIQIEDGKINIKKAKIILRKGEKVNESAAGIMTKLDIKPFKVGFEPIAAYDTKEDKLYIDIKIDKKGTLNEFKDKYSRALAFSVSIAYPTGDNIGFLLSKATGYYASLKKSEEKENKNNKEEGKGDSQQNKSKTEEGKEEK